MMGNVVGVAQFLETAGVPAGQAGAQVGPESGSGQNFAAAMQQAGSESGTAIPQPVGEQGEDAVSPNGATTASPASAQNAGVAAGSPQTPSMSAAAASLPARRGAVAAHPGAGTFAPGNKVAPAKIGTAVGTAKSTQITVLPGFVKATGTAASTLQGVAVQAVQTASANGQGAASVALQPAAPASVDLSNGNAVATGTSLIAEVTAPLTELAGANSTASSLPSSAASGTARPSKQTVADESKSSAKASSGVAVDSRLTATVAQGTAVVPQSVVASADGNAATNAVLIATVAPVPVSAPATQSSLNAPVPVGVPLAAASPAFGLRGTTGQTAGAKLTGSDANSPSTTIKSFTLVNSSTVTAGAAFSTPAGSALPVAETAPAAAAKSLDGDQVASLAAGIGAQPLVPGASGTVPQPGAPVGNSFGVPAPAAAIQQSVGTNGSALGTQAGVAMGLPLAVAAPTVGTLKTSLAGGRNTVASKISNQAALANATQPMDSEQTAVAAPPNVNGTGATTNGSAAATGHPVQGSAAVVGQVADTGGQQAAQAVDPAASARPTLPAAAPPATAHKATATDGLTTTAPAADSARDTAAVVEPSAVAQPSVVAADPGAAAIVGVGTVTALPHAAVTAIAPASGTSVQDGLVSAAQAQNSGVAGASLAHTTLSATPTSLEVGVASGTHGWLKIRAELNAAGEVNASLTGANAAADSKLRGDLPALSSYLQGEKVQLGALNVGAALHTAATESSSTFSFGGGSANGSAVSADAGAAGGRAQQQSAQQSQQGGGDSVPVSNGVQDVDAVLVGRIPDAAAYGVQTELGGSDAASSAEYGAGGGWLNVRV